MTNDGIIKRVSKRDIHVDVEDHSHSLLRLPPVLYLLPLRPHFPQRVQRQQVRVVPEHVVVFEETDNHDNA